MSKVFIDTSVILAASGSDKGASCSVLRLCQKKKVTGYVSNIVIKETLRNLKKKFSEKHLINFLNFLPQSNLKQIKLGNEVEIAQLSTLTHEKDVHVLTGAMKSKSSYVITLDKKHLLSLKSKNLPFKILTPKEFLSTEVLKK